MFWVLFFFFGPKACGILLPDQGLGPQGLNQGLSGKSPGIPFLFKIIHTGNSLVIWQLGPYSVVKNK